MRTLVIALSLLVAGCSSPSRIVEEAAAAAGRGDRGAYIACFTPRSRSLLRSLYTVADAEKSDLARLGNVGTSVTEVRAMAPGDKGQDRALVTVTEAGQTLPLVVHANAGAWRIDLLDSERASSGFGSAF